MPSASKPAMTLLPVWGHAKTRHDGRAGWWWVCGSVAQMDGFPVDTAARGFVPTPFTAGAAAVSNRHLAGRVRGDAGDGHGARHLIRGESYLLSHGIPPVVRRLSPGIGALLRSDPSRPLLRAMLSSHQPATVRTGLR